jgi:hypothetical protein
MRVQLVPEEGKAFKPCLTLEAARMQYVWTRKQKYDDERPPTQLLISLGLLPVKYELTE